MDFVRSEVVELEAEQMEQATPYAHAREHWSETCLTDAEGVPANIRTFMLYATPDGASPIHDVAPGKLTEVGLD